MFDPEQVNRYRSVDFPQQDNSLPIGWREKHDISDNDMVLASDYDQLLALYLQQKKG
jgi:hypothetical protein